MKLLRDVARRTGEYHDDAIDNWHGGDDYPDHIGTTMCCGWVYSQMALDQDRIMHMGYCINYNPNGINEY